MQDKDILKKELDDVKSMCVRFEQKIDSINKKMENLEEKREQGDLRMTTTSNKRMLEENETSGAAKKLKRGDHCSSPKKIDPDVFQVESRFSDDKLKRLSGFIGMEWEMLGTYLRFRYEEICKIRSRYPHDVDKAIFALLRFWRDKSPLDDMNKCIELSRALRRAGRVDLATKVTDNNL